MTTTHPLAATAARAIRAVNATLFKQTSANDPSHFSVCFTFDGDTHGWLIHNCNAGVWQMWHRGCDGWADLAPTHAHAVYLAAAADHYLQRRFTP